MQKRNEHLNVFVHKGPHCSLIPKFSAEQQVFVMKFIVLLYFFIEFC